MGEGLDAADERRCNRPQRGLRVHHDAPHREGSMEELWPDGTEGALVHPRGVSRGDPGNGPGAWSDG